MNRETLSIKELDVINTIKGRHENIRGKRGVGREENHQLEILEIIIYVLYMVLHI